jgi:diguanylate cyclase (GGDEF)-like protein
VRLITRSDASLAIGLIVGSIVLFQQPLQFVLEAARDVETRFNLDLVPALTIVAGVFIFHQYRKRLLSKAEAKAASAEAVRARVRSEELERLMTFSQDLAQVLDVAMLQQVLWKNLPLLTRTRGFWVLARTGGQWQEVIQDATTTQKRSMDALELMANTVLSKSAHSGAANEGVSEPDGLYFPLLAGGEAVGVLGTDDEIAARDDRKTIAAAAALIAIALRNVQLFGETREQGRRDRLTGCVNHQQCLETLDVELRRARRSGRPMSIVMFDIDHFKSINDDLGHLRGDEILRAVGAQLTRLLRVTDVSCRYGGDEFLIILPDTGAAGAELVAQTLRREIATLVISTSAERVLPVTASFGVATAAPAEVDVATLIKRADEALYRAKRAGRNRACVAIDPGATPGSQSPGTDPNASAACAVTGTETILVAEDEPLMQEWIRRTLEQCGYTILVASNAADAIAAGEARRGRIDLLLTDVVMPDLLGPDLAERLQRLRPEIKVLYISGFSDHPAVSHASLGQDVAFLQKPFTVAALSTKVREALDAAFEPAPVA